MAQGLGGAVDVEAVAVVGDRQAETATVAAQRDLDRAGPGVDEGVAYRLLGTAKERQLAPRRQGAVGAALDLQLDSRPALGSQALGLDSATRRR